MKLSLRWLSRHVDLSGIEPRRILEDLTMSTAEIEGLSLFGEGLEPILVGHVVECGKHQGADNLSVCRVFVGSGPPVQIVCGARNVEKGQKVAVILPGETLPAAGAKGALKIKVAKVRGVESHGMICSEQELGLSEDHSGILVLPDDLEPGRRLVDALPIQDHVFEIDNKSINHRPDLWGHYGFARELAAIYGRELLPIASPIPFPERGDRVEIAIDDAEGCPRYCGAVFEGLHAGPSPIELRLLLQAVGQRPIDLPVDLTNFVMLDLGQPMHAFDRRFLEGRSVRVRRARAGEKLRTLDGVERKLAEEDLLICADDEPIALAGIMGGAGTMVSEDTTSIFLESANFRASSIRRTSLRTGLRTDASARFEKAQDPRNADLAVHRFAALLSEWCPGAGPAGPLAAAGGALSDPLVIRLRSARLARKLGVEIPSERVEKILSSLQFGVVPAEDGFDVAVPSFRATKDISIEDDLIEEVGRMFRYDNIPERPLTSEVRPVPRNEELVLSRRIVEVATASLACHEVYNYSFVPDEVVEAAAMGSLPHARLSNPVSPETARIRRHVLPSLLASLRLNLRQRTEVRLVEHGKGYHPEARDEHGLPHEIREIAFAFGRREGPHPAGELRSGLELLLRRLSFEPRLARLWNGKDQPYAHPLRSVAIEHDGTPVGFVGQLHPGVLRAFDLPKATAIACIDVRALLSTGRKTPRYEPIPVFPELPVDVALLVDEGTHVEAVDGFLRRAGKKLVRSVRLFEVYRGEGIPAGRKSLNFTVTLCAPDRTLTSEDESKFLERVRQQAPEIGAELRG
ncbi:MAG: phenylalanine--tRNA ligase subunit beta [Planctomycetota bacterium]